MRSCRINTALPSARIQTEPNSSSACAKAQFELLRGRVVDFDFDERKGLAFVTIETPDEVRLKFADVAALADDPDGIYWIGPLNIFVPEGAEAS